MARTVTKLLCKAINRRKVEDSNWIKIVKSMLMLMLPDRKTSDDQNLVAHIVDHYFWQ